MIGGTGSDRGAEVGQLIAAKDELSLKVGFQGGQVGGGVDEGGLAGFRGYS
jgi:hypothetical protein